MSAHSGALEAVERILNRGGEAETVLTAVAAGRDVHLLSTGGTQRALRHIGRASGLELPLLEAVLPSNQRHLDYTPLDT